MGLSINGKEYTGIQGLLLTIILLPILIPVAVIFLFVGLILLFAGLIIGSMMLFILGYEKLTGKPPKGWKIVRDGEKINVVRV